MKSADKPPRSLTCLPILLFAAISVQAVGLSLPNVVGHNMVLQRGQSVPIWGWAAPGQKVVVQFAGQKREAKADKTGRWEVRLKSMRASSESRDLIIEAGELRILTNILVGEVWFCSGQSNMEKPVGEQRGQRPVLNYREELAAANYPLIRFFKTARTSSATVATNVDGFWSVCSSNSLEATKFSAAAYFFGREIHRELDVPVGLIESSWGGTRIEPWTPLWALEKESSLSRYVEGARAGEKVDGQYPCRLWNGMVAPIRSFAIRGALWYQGESNCMDTQDGLAYAEKMRVMIEAWRKAWGQGDFAFYYVQLAPYAYHTSRPERVPNPDALPELWEAQTLALNVKNTGMIVTTDLVHDLKDIHPIDKLDVGKRLALIALAKSYGRRVEYSGPLFERMKVRDGKVVISFRHTGGGLVSKDGNALNWFTLAGADGVFHDALAEIEGNTVVVSSPEVTAPKTVRFAWNEMAEPNLFNEAGLPAVPFRTDGPLTEHFDTKF